MNTLYKLTRFKAIKYNVRHNDTWHDIYVNTKPGTKSEALLQYIIGIGSTPPKACGISDEVECNDLKQETFSDADVPYESRYFNKTFVFNDGRVLSMDYLSNSFGHISQPIVYHNWDLNTVWVK